MGWVIASGVLACVCAALLYVLVRGLAPPPKQIPEKEVEDDEESYESPSYTDRAEARVEEAMGDVPDGDGDADYAAGFELRAKQILGEE